MPPSRLGRHIHWSVSAAHGTLHPDKPNRFWVEDLPHFFRFLSAKSLPFVSGFSCPCVHKVLAACRFYFLGLAGFSSWVLLPPCIAFVCLWRKSIYHFEALFSLPAGYRLVSAADIDLFDGVKRSRKKQGGRDFFFFFVLFFWSFCSVFVRNSWIGKMRSACFGGGRWVDKEVCLVL